MLVTESALDFVKPSECRTEVNLSNQARGACFKPYKAFFSLHTFEEQRNQSSRVVESYKLHLLVLHEERHC